MVLRDAEVDDGVADHREERLGADSAGPDEGEAELLLVDGGGREQRGLDPAQEPFGRGGRSFVELLDRFERMRHPRRETIAQRDHAVDYIPTPQRERARNLRIRQPDPAGVQPERLREQHQRFAVVPDCLLGLATFRPRHDEVIPHAGELPILPHPARERPRLLEHELDVKAGGAIDLRDRILQHADLFRLDRAVDIPAHGMALLYGF